VDLAEALAHGVSAFWQSVTMATMLENKPVPDQLRQSQRALRHRLDAVRQRLRLHLLVEGLFWVIGAVVLAAVASLLLDWSLRFNLPTRLGLLAIAVAAIVWLAYQRLLRPLLLPLDHLDLAELLDRRAPGVGQRISNVLQLPDLLAQDHQASPSMVHAAVAECSESLDRVDLAAPLNVSRRHKLVAVSVVLIVATVAFCLLWPAVAQLWARRWLAGSTQRWPQQTYLQVVGLGDEHSLLVPRGETSLVLIDARPKFVAQDGHWLLPGRGEPLAIEGAETPRSESPSQVSVSYVQADGGTRRGNAVQFDESSFRYELPPLAEPIALYITGGDDWLGPIVIEPIARPTVSVLEITATRPGGSNPQIQRVGEGTQQLLYLPETELVLRLVADGPLQSAEAISNGQPAAGWQRVDEKTYTLTWTMKESSTIEFRLFSERGALASKPYFLTIGLLKDREPRVTIRSSGVGRRVTPVARIPLSLRANDDFGVAALALDWERTAVRDDKPNVETKHEDLEKLPGSNGQGALRGEIEIDHELALRDRGLTPGNALKLRGVATDNCALGAQAGNSRWLAFQIVAPDELFYDILTRQREQRAKFSAALDSAKEQGKTLATLDKPEQALGVSRAEQVIARSVWQVANQLDANLLEMTLNDLGNPQARESLQASVITPLRTLHAELLLPLRASVDALAQQSTVSEERRAETIKLSDQAIESMQGILAQMSLWESFIDVVNQLKQIIDRQGQVLKSTEEIEKQRTDDLFDK
jgi:hypothetical protein